MRRNSGGNSASVGRGSLTDLYVSPEALEDVRNWGLDQIDEVTRREIYTAAEGGAPITRIFMNLHDLDELEKVKNTKTSSPIRYLEQFNSAMWN